MPKIAVTEEQRSILDRMLHEEKWPHLDRPTFLEELYQVAATALAKGTVEGHLASLLINHQLSDEMLRVLIDEARFCIQCSVFPSTTSFKKIDDEPTGTLIKHLESTLTFHLRDDILERVRRLNQIRVNLVHRLTKRSSLADLEPDCHEAKRLVEELFKLFWEADHEFRGLFKRNWSTADSFVAMHGIRI